MICRTPTCALRPVEGMHPIALQLGHLIVGEQMFNEHDQARLGPPLPDGFKEAHDLKNKELTDAGFVSKDKYSSCSRLSEPPRKPCSTRRPTPTWTTRATASCLRSHRRSGALAHGRHALAESRRSVRGGAAHAQEADRVLNSSVGDSPGGACIGETAAARPRES